MATDDDDDDDDDIDVTAQGKQELPRNNNAETSGHTFPYFRS